MKRNKNLIELSRDHHYSLLLSWKIRYGLQKGVTVKEIVQYTIHFFNKALIPHFEEEEAYVLTHLDEDDSFRKRTVEEHLEIKEMIRGVSAPGFYDTEVLLRVAKKIESHIRFEERELFPYIEALLAPDQLDAIGKRVQEHHQPYSETYPNEFWKR